MSQSVGITQSGERVIERRSGIDRRTVPSHEPAPDFEPLFERLNANGGRCYKEHAALIRAFFARSHELTNAAPQSHESARPKAVQSHESAVAAQNTAITITVWKDGSYLCQRIGDDYYSRNNPDWLCSIPLLPTYHHSDEECAANRDWLGEPEQPDVVGAPSRDPASPQSRHGE
jgi:hypothetical protein